MHDSNFGQPSQGQDTELAFRHPDSAEFLETLLGHLLGPDTQDDVQNDNEPPQWHETSVEDLVQMVDAAREEAYRKAQNVRLGYQVFVCAKQALRDQGIKTSVPNSREESTLEFLCRVARGKIMRDISYLVMAVTYVVLFTHYGRNADRVPPSASCRMLNWSVCCLHYTRYSTTCLHHCDARKPPVESLSLKPELVYQQIRTLIRIQHLQLDSG